MKPQLTMDINITRQCNFRCKYCSHDFKKDESFGNVDLFISRVKEIMELDWFKEDYNGVCVTFWGGEPTLKIDVLKYILKQHRPLLSQHDHKW